MTWTSQLTLLEEFMLLALDDRAARLHPVERGALDRATAGALLMDLTLQNRVDNDLQDAFVVDNAPLNDDLLDPVLQMMTLVSSLNPRPIAQWISQLADEGEAYRGKALRRLELQGIVRREDRKILWLIPVSRYPLVIASKSRDVKARVLRVVMDDEVPSLHDVMLIALADACGLFRHLLGMVEARASAPRIAQIAAMDLIGQAVAKTVATPNPVKNQA